MSEKNLKAFFEKVEQNKELKTKLLALDNINDKNSAINELLKIASLEGFEFSATEIKNSRKKMPNSVQFADVFSPSSSSDCTIEWPGCVEPNAAGCIIASPVPNCPGHADLLCSFASEEKNM